MTDYVQKGIWAIQEKSTGKFIKFGAKAAWGSSGAAKGAFTYPRWGYGEKRPAFDDQDEFVLVNLEECYFMYKGLCE